MAVEVLVPRLGWTMEEGTFGGWLKGDGDEVQEGDPLFVLESDKATQEVEAIESGILRIAGDAPESGATVLVGVLLGYIVQPGESVPVAKEPAAAEKGRQAAAASSLSSAASPSVVRSLRSGKTTPTISPRARRIANELGIDWTGLQGSGSSGRIVEKDVRLATESTPARSMGGPRGRALPTTQLRRIIAQRMSASAHLTAPVTLTTEVDATELVALRERLKAQAPSRAPTYTDLIVKLTAVALQRHPKLNAYWRDDQLLILEDIHIGIAVDTEDGLLVPVVRNVQNLDFASIAEESRSLAEKARSRRLSPDELQGGTFTITNLGSYGIDAFTPIINAPECAVLGVGRIVRKPAVHEDRVVPRDQLALSLTFDHRAVDGGPAARFLGTIRELLEEPGSI